jgi:hypothetical protein
VRVAVVVEAVELSVVVVPSLYKSVRRRAELDGAIWLSGSLKDNQHAFYLFSCCFAVGLTTVSSHT